jgi:hypothetical protein
VTAVIIGESRPARRSVRDMSTNPCRLSPRSVIDVKCRPRRFASRAGSLRAMD